MFLVAWRAQLHEDVRPDIMAQHAHCQAVARRGHFRPFVCRGRTRGTSEDGLPQGMRNLGHGLGAVSAAPQSAMTNKSNT